MRFIIGLIVLAFSLTVHGAEPVRTAQVDDSPANVPQSRPLDVPNAPATAIEDHTNGDTAQMKQALLSLPQARAFLNRSLSTADKEWLHKATMEHLAGCRLPAKDGTFLYTPDGVGNYRALWTRDFEYMVHNAGSLFKRDDIRAGVLYLLRGQRADGCMPDRVTAAGTPVYSPGPENKPIADHALDNGAFMALLAVDYLTLSRDEDFFHLHEPALRRGLDFVNRADNGLVYNDPARPQCTYGFTDCVGKTGHQLFDSLLYGEACVRMADACRQCRCGEPEIYEQRAALIRKNIELLWDDRAGMFLAADRDCRQIDIWGSALAVYLDVASPQQADRICAFLDRHAGDVFQRGQVRHLPGKETWSRLLHPVAPNTYQNGAFWATPLAWLLPALCTHKPDLAARLLRDAIRDFRANGANECINKDYRGVPQYVVSLTNVYGLCDTPKR